MKKVFLFLVFATWLSPAWGKGVYLSTEDFLKLAFPEETPVLNKYWLDGEDKELAKEILLHPYKGLRVRHWQQGERTAWIFNEIGKTEPITIGVVIEGTQTPQIVSMHILEFRESRGWEVKYPFFLEQFDNLSLDKQNKLTDNIDGITGATLSVRAVSKTARWALYLHGRVTAQ